MGLTDDFFDDDNIYTLEEGSPSEECLSLSQDVPDILTPPPLPPPLPKLPQYVCDDDDDMTLPLSHDCHNQDTYYSGLDETTHSFNAGNHHASTSTRGNAGTTSTFQQLMNKPNRHHIPVTSTAVVPSHKLTEDEHLVKEKRPSSIACQPSSKRYCSRISQPLKPASNMSLSSSLSSNERIPTSHTVKPHTAAYPTVNGRLYQSGSSISDPQIQSSLHAALPTLNTQQYTSTTNYSTTDYHQCSGQPSSSDIGSSISSSTATTGATGAQPHSLSFFTSSSNVR